MHSSGFSLRAFTFQGFRLGYSLLRVLVLGLSFLLDSLLMYGLRLREKIPAGFTPQGFRLGYSLLDYGFGLGYSLLRVFVLDEGFVLDLLFRVFVFGPGSMSNNNMSPIKTVAK